MGNIKSFFFVVVVVVTNPLVRERREGLFWVVATWWIRCIIGKKKKTGTIFTHECRHRGYGGHSMIGLAELGKRLEWS